MAESHAEGWNVSLTSAGETAVRTHEDSVWTLMRLTGWYQDCIWHQALIYMAQERMNPEVPIRRRILAPQNCMFALLCILVNLLVLTMQAVQAQ